MSQIAETGAAAAQKVATAATYAGSGTAVWGGWTANELAAFGGLLVAFLGLVISQTMNFYFKLQHLRIAQKAAKADEDE